MSDIINSTTARCSLLVFYDEDTDEEILNIQRGFTEDELAMRVPKIGEKVTLASYKECFPNGEPIFRHDYIVTDVMTHYLESRKYNFISVQYSVTVKEFKETEYET